MQKKLFRRITASLILSVMLFALPVGAFIANTSNAVTAYAEDDVSGNESGDNTDPGDGTGDATDGETIGGETGDGNTDNGNAGDGETGNGNSDNGEGDESGEGGEEGDDPEPTPEPTPEPEPECICEHKCSQYDYNKDCPVCSANYKDCQYKDPSVKITIDAPSGWYGRGSSVKVKFKVEDILDTGNFAVKSVRARSRSINCFDTTKPTLNAAVSEGLLTVQASDTESGIKVIYVNGYEFKDDITNGTLNIRLSQFDAGYEYFTITAMDNAGNVSEVYKTKNPYYKDPNSEDDSNPAEQLPASAEATNPSSATATVTQHTQTDSNGNTTSQTPKTPEQQKKEEFAKADAEEAALSEGEDKGEDMNLGKEFYTIEAASGKVFYLIIDRDGEEEMVYFLTEITENDLLNVTTDNSETLPKNSAALESQIPVTESALPNNNTDYEETHEVTTPTETPAEESTEEPTEEPAEEEPEPVKSNPLVGYLIMGILGAGVIGAAYYFKVVRKKQDGDFVEDEDEEDEDEDYESEDETSSEDDFFSETEKSESERPAPSADDVADTIEDADEDDDPYESDSDKE